VHAIITLPEPENDDDFVQVHEHQGIFLWDQKITKIHEIGFSLV
jgi:hypothetical protein